jgi:hypothetical protein
MTERKLGSVGAMRRFEPHPYQEDAIAFLLQNAGSALFLDPG